MRSRCTSALSVKNITLDLLRTLWRAPRIFHQARRAVNLRLFWAAKAFAAALNCWAGTTFRIYLAAAACAYKLGLSLEQIERGICGLEPVEHRLKIIASSPMTVIDDAFNSSPNGARAALEVLAQFKGRRIIVTPGFVELGPKQDEYHFQLGCQIAESADIAILVLPERTAEIKRGLLEKGFEPEKIYEARSLQEAAGLLEGIGLPGDTVLFENDLPDNYA